MYAPLYVYVYIFAYIYIYTYIHIYIYMHMYVSICIYTFIYRYGCGHGRRRSGRGGGRGGCASAADSSKTGSQLFLGEDEARSAPAAVWVGARIGFLCACAEEGNASRKLAPGLLRPHSECGAVGE